MFKKKHFILFGILILPYTILAYKLLYMNKEINNDSVNTKRSEIKSTDECKYVENFISEVQHHDCCYYGGYVYCDNGHITGL